MKKTTTAQPDIAILVRYIRGDKKPMAYWSRFIERDEAAQEKVALLTRLARMFVASDVQRLSTASQTLARHIFQSYKSAAAGSGEEIAHLYYDSRVIPLPEGVRPSLMSTRRMKFKAGAGQIELSISPIYPGRFEITGRYQGPLSIQKGRAVLKGRRSHQGIFDNFGFFYLAPVDPGRYRLTCQLADQEYLIPVMEL
jgi:hypothetical protein